MKKITTLALSLGLLSAIVFSGCSSKTMDNSMSNENKNPHEKLSKDKFLPESMGK